MTFGQKKKEKREKERERERERIGAQFQPQLANMPSHEWWSCKLTTFTPHSQLATKQVLAKFVIITFFKSSKINYGVR